VVGFAFTELLGFRLLPQLKNIGMLRLYRPDDQHRHAKLGPVLTRPICRELIAQQYNQTIRDATALRLGTTESEQNTPRPRRSPCTCSDRRWCTSTPCSCRPFWKRPSSMTGWAPTSGAG
jgi:hypothetical protein